MDIKELLEIGRRDGYVSMSDFKSALPSEITEEDQIQDIIEYLNDLGIEVRTTSAEVVRLFDKDRE